MEYLRKTYKKLVEKYASFFASKKLLKRLLAGRKNPTITQEKRREYKKQKEKEREKAAAVADGILRKGEVLWLMLPGSFRNPWADFSRPAADCRSSLG